MTFPTIMALIYGEGSISALRAATARQALPSIVPSL
jgi:hypothetical protein